MLPRSVFFHIPKTGGTWVRRAIANAGIPTVEVGDSDNQDINHHNSFHQVDVRGKFTFTFVRHPLDWYASFWSCRMNIHPTAPYRDLIGRYLSDNFEQFLRDVFKDLPGHLSKRYERYVGSFPGVLDFVGKQENLLEDLIQALKTAGEAFDDEKIRATPPENVSTNRPEYSPDLLRAVLESEYEAMVRFGYASPWLDPPALTPLWEPVLSAETSGGCLL